MLITTRLDTPTFPSRVHSFRGMKTSLYSETDRQWGFPGPSYIPAPVFLKQLTLDCPVCVDIRALDSEQLGSLELYSREYINTIHMKRLWAPRNISQEERDYSAKLLQRM